jgi:hypothetical protein
VRSIASACMSTFAVLLEEYVGINARHIKANTQGMSPGKWKSVAVPVGFRVPHALLPGTGVSQSSFS